VDSETYNSTVYALEEDSEHKSTTQPTPLQVQVQAQANAVAPSFQQVETDEPDTTFSGEVASPAAL